MRMGNGVLRICQFCFAACLLGSVYWCDGRLMTSIMLCGRRTAPRPPQPCLPPAPLCSPLSPPWVDCLDLWLRLLLWLARQMGSLGRCALVHSACAGEG